MLQKWEYKRFGKTLTFPSRTNDKNWKEYLAAMRGYYKNLKSTTYEPYSNGEKATYKIIKKMGNNVKTASKLYTEEFNATWYVGWEWKLAKSMA